MRSLRSGLTGMFALMLVIGAGPAVTAQGILDASFPARIIAGSCDDLGQDAAFQLADLTYGLAEEDGAAGSGAGMTAMGAPETVLVATGVTQLDVTAAELTEPAHVVAVFAPGSEDAVACGAIGGIAPEENLFFGVQEENGSGHTGIGWLTSMDDGVLLTLMLASPEAVAGDAAAATAKATPGAMATPTAAATTEETAAATPGEAAVSPTADATPAEDAAATAETVTIESIDIAFVPEEVTIPADTDVTIELPNNGVTLHNFAIDAKNNDGLPIDPISVDIAPGATEQITVNLPAGEYYFYCNIPGHEAAGMFGTLIVG